MQSSVLPLHVDELMSHGKPNRKGAQNVKAPSKLDASRNETMRGKKSQTHQYQCIAPHRCLEIRHLGWSTQRLPRNFRDRVMCRFRCSAFPSNRMRILCCHQRSTVMDRGTSQYAICKSEVEKSHRREKC